MKKLCLLALCLLPFWNCSDSSRVNPDEIPRLSAYIHFVPSRYYGVAYREFPSVRTKAIPAGDAGQLVAEIRINGIRSPKVSFPTSSKIFCGKSTERAMYLPRYPAHFPIPEFSISYSKP